MSQPGETLVAFLTSWLGLHILGVDHSLSRQIQLIRGGVSADEAFQREAAAHDNGMQAVLRRVANLDHLLTQQNMALAQANQALEARVAQAVQSAMLRGPGRQGECGRLQHTAHRQSGRTWPGGTGRCGLVQREEIGQKPLRQPGPVGQARGPTSGPAP